MRFCVGVGAMCTVSAVCGSQCFRADVLKTTLQLPVPAESVMVQLVSAPVMATVPVGVVEPPVTVTVTFTVPPPADGSGVSDVMVTVEGGKPTV